MRHQVFDRLILDRFPCPGNGEHKAPPTSKIVGVALHNHLYVVLRAIGCVTLYNDSLGPGWRDKASDHLAKQRILRLIGWMAFRSDQAERHWEGNGGPVDKQQGEANPEKPGFVVVLLFFLGLGILHAP